MLLIIQIYLSSHKYVVDTFVERIEEILNDENNNFMNCASCKYRSNLFGFEKEVGMIQESHHEHVEGLGISCDLCDSECNGACEIDSKNSLGRQFQRNISLEENLKEKEFLSDSHEEHSHHHHHHHHHIYPNSKHPLGPVTLRLTNEDQILRNTVENS